MKKLLFAFMAVTLFACSGDDSTPVDPNNGNPNPENPNPVEVCDNVYNGNVELSTQEELDAFAAHGYCKINGKLSIGFRIEDVGGDGEEIVPIYSTITSLAGLSTIRQITGGLQISGNPLLPNLEGLNNLKSVGAGLGIGNNTQLVDISALSSLTELSQTNIFGSLYIQDNPVLPNLHGLENIKSAYDVIVENNWALQDFQGLNGLEKVHQMFTVADNTAMTSFQGLNSLKEVALSFGVSGSNALLSLDGLDSLETVNMLSVGYCTGLTSLGAAPQLKNVTILSLYNLPSLVSLEALTNVEQIASIYITHCTALTSLNGLQNVKEVGNLQISNNNSLTSLSQLSGLTTVKPSPDYLENNFWIYNNDAIQSLDGLQNIIQFEASLSISKNDGLSDFCALSTILSTAVLNDPAYIANNLYNPTVQDIASGNCSQP